MFFCLLANTARVVIDIQDENDHPPLFSRPLYIGGVAEDAKTFTSVLKVQVQKSHTSNQTAGGGQSVGTCRNIILIMKQSLLAMVSVVATAVQIVFRKIQL